MDTPFGGPSDMPDETPYGTQETEGTLPSAPDGEQHMVPTHADMPAAPPGALAATRVSLGEAPSLSLSGMTPRGFVPRSTTRLA